MFGLKKKKKSNNDSFISNTVVSTSTNTAADTSNSNRIGVGTEIQGEIISEGTIRIEGTLDGYLESKSRIIIGDTGVVKGDIKCKSMDISGRVVGTVHVEEILTLKDKSYVEGDIHARKLIIEPGANFNGNCKMGSIVTPSIGAGKPTAQDLSNKKVG